MILQMFLFNFSFLQKMKWIKSRLQIKKSEADSLA